MTMTLNEIKAAVQAGKTVHWMNTGYVVTCDKLGQWHIRHTPTGHCIGLTHRDGTTVNGRPEEFFLAQQADLPSLRTILAARGDISINIIVNGTLITSADPCEDIPGVWRLATHADEQEFLIDPEQVVDLDTAVIHIRVGFDGQDIAGPEDLPKQALLVVEHFRPATNEDFVKSTTTPR